MKRKEFFKKLKEYLISFFAQKYKLNPTYKWKMVAFVGSILFTILVATVELVQSDGVRFAKQCLGLNVVETLQRSASTVQSYFGIERNISESHFKIPGAEPRQIWMYIRQGTQIPSTEKLAALKELDNLRDKIIENFNNYKNIPFCESNWNKLVQWKWDENITIEQAQTLTTRGQEEIRLIARSIKHHFPELFDDVYSPITYNFQHTDSDASRSSFNAFVDELFGHNAHLKIDAEPTEESEKLLEPYKECAAFVEQQEYLIDTESEVEKFFESRTFQNVIKEVSRRLRFKKKLKKRDILNMYDMCRYSQAWTQNATCIWCIMFTSRELKVLEYANDLKSYYEFGYGSNINRQIQCSSVRDMVSHLEFSVDPRVSIYFGQSSSLLLHLTAMGAFQDEKALTAKSFLKMSQRKWSTSKMSPFAGNFAAIRYSTKQVKFFLNEELVQFDWCPAGVCQLADVRRTYKELNNCNTIYCPVVDDESDSIFRLILKSIF